MLKYIKKYLYVLVWILSLCMFLALRMINDYIYILKTAYVVLGVSNMLIAQFRISKAGDELVREKDKALYDHYSKYNQFYVWPTNITAILLLKGEYKKYKYLNGVILETLVYLIYSIAFLISLILVINIK